MGHAGRRDFCVCIAACMNLEEFMKNNLIINSFCMHPSCSLEEGPTHEVNVRLRFTYNVRHETLPMAARPKIFRIHKPWVSWYNRMRN